MTSAQIFDLLESKYEQYNKPNYIEADPICIPHSFSKQQDIEIAGLFASTLAWGLRKTIINKCKELITSMDNAPHDFILNHKEQDLKRFLAFKHRTFNATDTLYFIDFLKRHYQQSDTLEDLFLPKIVNKEINVEKGLINFHKTFFDSPNAPDRTKKHVATPLRKSACKRLNMYLRWMVRDDSRGVDFGIWKNINASKLVIPLDVHVDRVARKLNLLQRKQSDWLSAVELTENLKKYDPIDPGKYDFSLFSIGVVEKAEI